MVDSYSKCIGKCREIYYTWILWVMVSFPYKDASSGSITTTSTGGLWHDVCVMRLFQKMYLTIKTRAKGGSVGFGIFNFVEPSCGQGVRVLQKTLESK